MINPFSFLIWFILQWSQMSSVYYICCPASLISSIKLINSSCILNNIIQFKTILRRCFLIIVSFRISKEELFFLFLSFYHVFGHLLAHQFWKVNIFLSVSKVWNFPLSFLLIPLWVIDNHVNLITTHEHIKNSWKLFDLFLLIPDSVK